MSWYKKGSEAKQALDKAEALSKMLKEKSVPRFWLKPDTQADIVFIDDDGFWCEVHTIKQGNQFIKATCSAGIRPCPLCLIDKNRPAGIVFFTVIDLRPYEKKDGTQVKYSKILLPARRTLAKQIFEFKEKYGSLRGLRFTLKRYTDKDASCGIIVGEAHRHPNGKIKIYDLTKLGKDFAIPYDYEKVLAPLTEEELKAFGIFVPATLGDTPIEDLEETIDEEEDLQDEELEEEEGEIPDEIEDEEPFDENEEFSEEESSEEFTEEPEEEDIPDEELEAIIEERILKSKDKKGKKSKK